MPCHKEILEDRKTQSARWAGQLSNDCQNENLKQQAISGSSITFIAQAGKFAILLIGGIILARLLTPKDFGLVAMVNALMSFLRIFKDAGLSAATVQSPKISHAQISNLFWVNVVGSLTLSIIVAGLAPALAWFYREDRLIGVTLGLSCTFALSGAAVQNQALLSRQLRFKAIALIELGSALTGLMAAVLMASIGCGYWSLVGLQLGTAVAELGLTFVISKWRPQPPTRNSGTRTMLSFGASLTMASVIRRVAGGADILLIGRCYGADALGLYSRGLALLMGPLEQFVAPFQAVATPVLSRLQGDPVRYRRVFLQFYNAVALVSLPVAGLFLGLSRPLVLVLLGAKWEQVVPIFAAFAIAAVYVPLYYGAMWLLNTQGRGKDIMRLGLILSGATIASIIGALPFGPVGVALSISCVNLVVRLPLQFCIIGRSGPVSTWDLCEVAVRYVPNLAIVYVTTYLTRSALPASWPPISQLPVCALVGAASGILMIMMIPSQRLNITRVVGLLKPVFLARFGR